MPTSHTTRLTPISSKLSRSRSHQPESLISDPLHLNPPIFARDATLIFKLLSLFPYFRELYPCLPLTATPSWHSHKPLSHHQPSALTGPLAPASAASRPLLIVAYFRNAFQLGISNLGMTDE